MKINIKQLTEQAEELFFPSIITSTDHETALNTIEIDLRARTTKIALFIFSTATTIVTILLTELKIVTGLGTPIAILICTIAWGLFLRLHLIENRYLENIDDSTRQDLAKKHLETLLFETPINEKQSLQQFLPMFAQINALLEVEIFSNIELEKFSTLDLSNSCTKTLFEVALDQKIDLSFNLETEKEEPGYFGSLPSKYKASIQWDGKRESPISIIKQKHQTTPQNPFDSFQEEHVASLPTSQPLTNEMTQNAV